MTNDRAITTTGGGMPMVTMDDFITWANQIWEGQEEPRQIAGNRTNLLLTWQGSSYYHQAAQQISRALRAKRTYSLTGEQWQETLSFFNDRCAYCGKAVGLFEMDHVFPHQLGGGFTMGNIVPSCMRCNRRKKDNSLEGCLDLGYIGLEAYGKILKWQRLQRRDVP